MWILLRLNDNRNRGRNLRPMYGRHDYRRRHHTRRHRPGAPLGPQNEPLFTCCNPTDKVVSSGVVSIILGVLCVIYATYEMHKAGDFYDNNGLIQLQELESNESTDSKKYYDKYGSEVSKEQFEYLIGQEQLDKGLCVGLTFCGIIFIISSSLLIRGARVRDYRSYVPWIVFAVLCMCMGFAYTLYNIITLDFHATINFILFLWIVGCVIEFHCLKSVVRVYKDLHSPENITEGVAIFDARSLNNDVFTITDGEMSPTRSPVRIMLKPPSYSEAITALDDLGPPPDPPDGDTGVTVPTEKPPEYTPLPSDINTAMSLPGTSTTIQDNGNCNNNNSAVRAGTSNMGYINEESPPEYTPTNTNQNNKMTLLKISNIIQANRSSIVDDNNDSTTDSERYTDLPGTSSMALNVTRNPLSYTTAKDNNCVTTSSNTKRAYQKNSCEASHREPDNSDNCLEDNGGESLMVDSTSNIQNNTEV